MSLRRPPKLPVPHASVLAATALALAAAAPADVKITELHAAPSERFLRWDDSGQPRLGGGPAWFDPEFDASAWPTGNAPMGFGFAGAATDLRPEMFGRTPTLYVRKTFELTAEQAASLSTLTLRIDYDDGFVCFLNGREAARERLGPRNLFVYADGTAFSARPTSPTGPIAVDLGPGNNLLQPGTNVIAIQIVNESIDAKGDLKFDAALEWAGEPALRVFGAGGSWSYRTGYGEPSGGVFEPNLPPVPNNPFDQNSVAPFPDLPEFSDWIELHNDGAEPVDLTGWSLSDDPAVPDLWSFPPGTSIPAGGYLLVLCDGNSDLPDLQYLHAAFQLGSAGESLFLSEGQSLRDSFEFPAQDAFHSFGRTAGGDAVYFSAPTPGAPNAGETLDSLCAVPEFTRDGGAPAPGGFLTGSQTLHIATETAGAEIRYTLDGTDPVRTSTLYLAPLTISPRTNRRGTVVRARAFRDGAIPSAIRTATFLVDQHASIRGVPALCFTGDDGRVFNEDFGVMAIRGGTYNSDGTWRASTAAAYHMPLMHGRAYERPVFVEWMTANGMPGFSEPAGLRVASSPWSRPRLRLTQNTASPWPADPVQKPSFNVFFRGSYGASEVGYPVFGQDYPVKSFEQFRARAGKNDISNPFIRDEVMRRLFTDMGGKSVRGTINTLYINGVYKGFYNTVERYRKPWFQAHYSSATDWDIRINDAVEDGSGTEWSRLMSAAARNLADRANWDAVLELLDVDEVIDYWLINIYAATWDWPNNNWVAARERSPRGRWRLYIWDAEGAFGHAGQKPPNYNTIQTDLRSASGTGNNQQSELFRRLYRSEEFRLRVADRIQRAFFNGGALDDRGTDSAFRRRVTELRTTFAPLLQFTHSTSFSDRFLRDWTTATTANLSQGNWTRAMSSRRSHLFEEDPVPTSRIGFRYHRLWPATEPPAFDRHGGPVAAGTTVAVTTNESAPAGSTVYYTIDGDDPRNWGGEPAAGATAVPVTAAPHTFQVPLPGRAQAVLRARVRNADGEWSALTDATFLIDTEPASPANLVVSRIMYHPPAPTTEEAAAGISDENDLEFLELMAIGPKAVDLSAVRFVAGVSFDFADAPVRALSPGTSLLLVKNAEAFRVRYGSGLDARIAGEFIGSLSNSGERLWLTGSGDTIRDFAFGDDPAAGWPIAADGRGAALVLAVPTSNPDHALAASWQATPEWGGAPGSGDSTPDTGWQSWLESRFSGPALSDPAVSGPVADPDRDGLANLVEFAIGGDPLGAQPVALTGRPEAWIAPASDAPDGPPFLHVRFVVLTDSLADVSVAAEAGNLGGWSPMPTPESAANSDGTTTLTFRDSSPAAASAARAVRIRLTAR